jgi:hypothetical protein
LCEHFLISSCCTATPEINDRPQDLKVYGIGDNYAYAEMRKAPAVDGIVERTADGKEVRIITTLNEEERMISRRIVQCFRQRICGFDILRAADGRSLVCDVNGLSFVKSNPQYFKDCGAMLYHMFDEYMTERDLQNAQFKDKRTSQSVCVVDGSQLLIRLSLSLCLYSLLVLSRSHLLLLIKPQSLIGMMEHYCSVLSYGWLVGWLGLGTLYTPISWFSISPNLLFSLSLSLSLCL